MRNIAFEDQANLINKRNEAISKCLHQDKYHVTCKI